jgi:hypothetical protein
LVRSAACATLIRQVLAHPKVLVFGELLVVPSVQKLADTEHASVLTLLNTFTHGTWGDLTPDAAHALVSMCSSLDVIFYEVLQRAVAERAVSSCWTLRLPRGL